MTERKGEVRPSSPEPGATEVMVVHKSTRECPVTQPHPRELCGLVQARERIRAEADRRAREAPGP